MAGREENLPVKREEPRVGEDFREPCPEPLLRPVLRERAIACLRLCLAGLSLEELAIVPRLVEACETSRRLASSGIFFLR